MDITFVISHLPDSRYKKRFEVLGKDRELSVVYWNKRGKENLNLADIHIPAFRADIPADQTSPLKRIPQWFRYARFALKQLICQSPRCVYVGNLDMLAIAWFYKRRKSPRVKVVYEIADLHRYIADIPRSPLKRLFRKMLIGIEARLISSVDLLTVTSWKFYETYYARWVPRDKTVLLPNMPQKEDFTHYCRKKSGEFTVGFIGSIRYKEQLKMLIHAGKRAGVRVFFAGAATDKEIESICRENREYCEFYGPFNYTQKIAELYGRLDCVYSVYDADMANVRIALPNKLYESILCCLPIIVARGTYLAELVEEWGVGVAVGHRDETELCRILERLKNDAEYYSALCQNCADHADKAEATSYITVFQDKIAQLFSVTEQL